MNTGDAVEYSGFTGPVWSDQSVDPPLANCHVKPVNRSQTAESFGYVFKYKIICCHVVSL
jgi:hypothetical protein